MHGIKGDDAVRDMEFAEQLLRGGDFVGLFRDIDVCQDRDRLRRRRRAAPGPPCGR